MRECDATAKKHDAALRGTKHHPRCCFFLHVQVTRARDYGHAEKSVQGQDFSAFVGTAHFSSRSLDTCLAVQSLHDPRPALHPEVGRGCLILRRADDCAPRQKRAAQAAHDAHPRHGHLSLHDDPVRGGPGVERARPRRGAHRGPQDFSRHAARRLNRRTQGAGHLPGRVDLQHCAEREDARRQHQGAGGRRGARQIP